MVDTIEKNNLKVHNSNKENSPILLMYGGMGVYDFNYFNLNGFINTAKEEYTLITVLHPAFSPKSKYHRLVTDNNSKEQIQEGLEKALQTNDKDIYLIGHSFSSPLVLRTINDLSEYIGQEFHRIKGAIITAPFTSIEEVLTTAKPTRLWKTAYNIGQHLPSWMPAPYCYSNPKQHVNNLPNPPRYTGAVRWLKARSAEFALSLKSEEHLNNINIPVLMILTNQDRIVPYESQLGLAHKLSTINNNTQIEVLNSGHNLFWDAPRQTIQIMKEWIEKK
jgi:pimeloyl-ACP methyl ester carboxylesterase